MPIPPGPSERSTIRRLPQRASYDRQVINQILDESMICQVALVQDGAPVVIPMNYVRMGDRVFVHGSKASRLLRLLASGVEACVSVTLLDGLVLARSAFHHSMNYRSVVFWGKGQVVTDLEEMTRVFKALMEKLAPGRWATIRQPNEIELKQTLVAAVPITEASAKVRTGPPKDDEEDLALPIWAGVLPLRIDAGTPVPDPALAATVDLPGHLKPRKRDL
jgi:nitroimidazol reductase NimA-like FMN-containing flavoprotein (pyridoxamine 5'-phosphate oxidase superfamily)